MRDHKIRAAKIRRDIEKYKIPMQQIATRVGKSRVYISSFFSNPPLESPLYEILENVVASFKESGLIGHVTRSYIEDNEYYDIPVQEGHSILWYREGKGNYIIVTTIDGMKIEVTYKNKIACINAIYAICKRHEAERGCGI